MCYQLQMLPNPENIVSKKSESTISSKIVINFHIVIWFGECSYLVLTINHSSGTRFVFIMAVLSNLSQLFGVSPAILTMSAMDIDNLHGMGKRLLRWEKEKKVVSLVVQS